MIYVRKKIIGGFDMKANQKIRSGVFADLFCDDIAFWSTAASLSL